MANDFSKRKYLLYKESGLNFLLKNPEFKKNKTRTTNQNNNNDPYDDGRNKLEDPLLLSNILSNVIEEKQWEKNLSQGNFLSKWVELVGPHIGAHTTPAGLSNGTLTIQASSTAWATQLNLISGDILEKIKKTEYADVVDEIVVIGPKSPSWKKGLRTIKGGRGPRDTYG